MKQRTLVIGLFFLLASCGLELPDSKVITKEIYDERVSQLKKERQERCKKEAFERAEAIVDSIVHDMLQIGLTDTLDFPEKPIRPEAPDHIIGTVKQFEVEK